MRCYAPCRLANFESRFYPCLLTTIAAILVLRRFLSGPVTARESVDKFIDRVAFTLNKFSTRIIYVPFRAAESCETTLVTHFQMISLNYIINSIFYLKMLYISLRYFVFTWRQVILAFSISSIYLSGIILRNLTHWDF